jgi:hypothetical protein
MRHEGLSSLPSRLSNSCPVELQRPRGRAGEKPSQYCDDYQISRDVHIRFIGDFLLPAQPDFRRPPFDGF